MIRKPPLAEVQSALGKQKIRSVERGYLSHCEVLWTTASPRCWVMAKNGFFKWRPSAMLNLWKIIFGHLAVTEFQMCCCVQNFIKWFFVEIWRFNYLRYGGVRHVEFSKFRVYVTWPLSPCYFGSMCKISLKSDNRLAASELWPKNDF